MEADINTLSRFPESGAPPRYRALRARGFRVLIVDQYPVFYNADSSQALVTVYDIVDGRRDCLNLI